MSQLSQLISLSDLQTKADYLFKKAKQKGLTDLDISVSGHIGFSSSVREHTLESLEHNQAQTLYLKGFLGKQKASVTTSDLSDSVLDVLIDKLYTLTRYVEEDVCEGLPDKSALAFDYPDLQLHFPWNITPEKAIKESLQCDEFISEYSELLHSDAIQLSTYEGFDWQANSNGFKGYYPYSEHSLGCYLIAKNSNDMQTDYEFSAARSSEHLLSFKELAEKAAKRTLNRLNARQLKTSCVPIIFEARVAKTLWHHLLSAISGTRLYRQMSFLQDQKDKKIFQDFVHVYQRPHLLSKLHSAPFDQEGVITQDISYIDSGYLKNYMLDTYSARRLGMQPTGNAGGVYNLMVTTQDLTLDQLCRQMDRGLLVTEFLGQGVDIVTGHYSRGAFGYWVENGEVQYPVHEITLAGSLPEIFQKIVAIGNDLILDNSVQTGSILVDKMMIAGL